ncbi:MAG TPA: TIGR03067 domain-containing protein [Gemmataceae bacterium]|jgi:uncharacterized protein (TIGR03067 family)|nr:TIGR03067 domain-containing protein [Gemmataceae bacterium]
MRQFIGLLFVLATPLIVTADNEDVRKEFKSLEGKWKAVSMEVEGKPVPNEQIPPFTITIAADGKGTGKLPDEEFRFKLTIDPKKDPKHMEAFHESGDQKGKKQFGVYKVEGDKFTVNMTPPDGKEADRPKDFSTKESMNVLFVFERVKEEKKP